MAASTGALRILHVSETHGGGVETLLRRFATEQVHAGHHVGVLAPPGMGRFAGVSHSVWLPDRSRPWTVVRALAALRTAVRLHRPDVVHLHSFMAGLFARVPGSERLLGMDLPVVYQPHAWAFEVFPTPAAGRAIRRWEAWAGRKTDVLVANCDDEVAEGRRAGVHGPARVLGVAVELERFRPVPAEQVAEARARLGLTHPRVLLCVGRLARQKGYDLLLRAWEQERPADAALVLVGPGDPAPLRSLAPTQWGTTVCAVGGHSDVRPWLWASDVLLLPSRYETVGLVVAEAMACGLPVVATAVNGARSTIVEGPLPPAGEVVPLGDMRALLRCAERRLDDSSLRAAEAAAGRHRAERLFRPADVAARLENAYREAIALHAERTRR